MIISAIRSWKIWLVSRSAKQCVSLKELKVNGQDLIAAGIKKGPKIGQTLQTLLQEVIEEPEKNTREYLLARIKELE